MNCRKNEKGKKTRENPRKSEKNGGNILFPPFFSVCEIEGL